jgi:hypothetical protein
MARTADEPVQAPRNQRPRRLARPRTPPFHGDNTGSNPVGDAKYFQAFRANRARSDFDVGNATVTMEPELASFSRFSSGSSGDSA